MTAPLLVLALLVAAWTATVWWSAWKRRQDERAMIQRAIAWVNETARSTGDLAAAVNVAIEGINKFGAAFLAGTPLDEEPPW